MTELIDKGYFIELARRDPREVCRRTSCAFDERHNCYTLPVWGVDYVIYPDAGKIECSTDSRPLHQYFSLVAIHYLLTAREISPVKQWISEKDMMGGATFFRGPHAIPTHLITSRAGNSIETFRQLGSVSHGSPLNLADAAFSLSITERIPVAVLYWAGDEDFPAEAKILYDKTLPNHFALDIVFALASGICEQLGR